MSSDKTEFPHCKHLIIVCCHAIWYGGETNGKDESEWAIEHFQAGETPTLIEHILAGLKAFHSLDNAMLVFSGGPTKQHITKLAEGESYRSLAYALDPSLPQDAPIIADSLATDSFQNLLLSLLLFHTRTGHEPEHITIVSHAFKRSRFIDQHCRTIRWPVEKTTYVGIDPPKDEAGRSLIETGEMKARKEWSEDWWGRGSSLGTKRVKRGWSDERLEGSEWAGWKRDLARWPSTVDERLMKDYPEKLPWEV